VAVIAVVPFAAWQQESSVNGVRAARVKVRNVAYPGNFKLPYRFYQEGILRKYTGRAILRGGSERFWRKNGGLRLSS
jgi:hypothetical protein